MADIPSTLKPGDDTINASKPAADSSIPAKTPTVEELQKQLEVAEKRVSDNRKNFLDANKAAKEQEALNKTLTTTLTELTAKTQELSPDEQKRLNDLKFSNPDKWYEEMQQLDAKKQTALNDRLSQAKEDAKLSAVKLTNEELLKEFVSNNPEITIDNLTYDVPYKLRTEYDNGTIALDVFLDGVTKFYGAKITTPNAKLPKQKDLGSLGGAEKASTEAKEKQQKDDYKDFVI